MEEVLDLAEKISVSIRESDAYKNYYRSKELIDNNKELKEKILDFKKKHIEFQEKKLRNEDVSFEEEKYISNLYFSLIRNEDAKMFFHNEKIILQLIGSIYKTLSDECRIDFEF